MKRSLIIWAVLGFLAASPFAAVRTATEKPGPQPSGFYDFLEFPSEVDNGIGNIGKFNCQIGAATQPADYAGNRLLDCDGEVPHNETSLTVNPLNPNHAVGAFHSYVTQFKGATTVNHVISTPSVTRDGGQTWRHVLPPVTPYQFSGDPAVTFNTQGHVFLASIADNEGPGGSYTAPDVIVQRSLDGGTTWSNPVTVARGLGAVTPNRFGLGLNVFNDKEYIAADTSLSSPHRDRLYVSWTRFEQFVTGNTAYFTERIRLSFSDDGVTWSEPKAISGFNNPHCSQHIEGLPSQPFECDLNQDSYPTVAPNGRVYVSFENFNTPAENQILVVRSNDGGNTWSAPVKAADIFDINLPTNVDNRATLTGCQLRWSAVANSAADPSDPTGNTVYVVFADNRSGTVIPDPMDPDDMDKATYITNTNVFLAKSTNGGATWSLIPVDTAVNDQFYPWVAVAQNGVVNVGYMDRIYGDANPTNQGVCKYGFSLTRLAPNGALISKQRVDTGLSHADESRWFSRTTDPRTRFIGDYNAVAVGSNGFTWSLWTDLRRVIPGLSPTLTSQHRTHGQHAVGTKTP